MRNPRKWKRKKVLMMVIIRISSLTTMMIGTKRRKYLPLKPTKELARKLMVGASNAGSASFRITKSLILSSLACD